jgi:biopolymer transport protein ExbD
MAEMDTSSGGGHKKGPGVKKGKKLSTRVDLTPMVDLGFLLITFFMFTTTLSKPKTMQINMPTDEKIEEKDKTKIKASTVVTVLLSKDHRVYYYEGIGDDATKPPEVKVTYFRPKDGIRDVIINKKKNVEDMIRAGGLSAKDQACIIIKPDTTSTYEDLVNILDEMSINDVRVYAIVDITPVDKEFITLTEQANGVQ